MTCKMPLTVKNTIKVHTDCGVREIQLCLGDITSLPKSEEVDVIMVSSFPNCYTPTPGTVIGALYKKFHLNVTQLSYEKAEDLRKHFHCWISQDLPSNLPYRRLLCFEKTGSQTAHEIQLKHFDIVGEVFRALFTILFNDKDRSVITPLLATGSQHSLKWKMLEAMVNSCASWMRAGLPLSRMKLVIYQNPKGSVADNDKRAIEHFQLLKKQIEVDLKNFSFSIKYDLYIGYSFYDKEKVDDFIKRLKEKHKQSKKELKMISNEINDANTSASKSHDNQIEAIKKKMLESNRVLLFLSPSFMKVNDGEGIEEYNIALCLSQLAKRDMLQPVYLQTIPDLPMYMSMTQWIDCRKKETDTVDLEVKINRAVDNTNRLLIGESKMQDTKSKSASQHYDVFLSYSHADSLVANIFLRSIKDLCPSAKIFFDRDEIKSGFSWQSTLYSALSNSRVVLALVSPSYLSSVICREEFAIGLTQHLCTEYSTVLIPVCISEKLIHKQDTELHGIFSYLPFLVPYINKEEEEETLPTNISTITITAAASYLAEQITMKIDHLNRNEILVCKPTTKPLEIDSTLGKARSDWFDRNIKLNEQGGTTSVQIVDEKNVIAESSSEKQEEELKELTEAGSPHVPTSAQPRIEEVKNIAISYHENDKCAALFLKARIKYFVGENVEVTKVNQSQEILSIEVIHQAEIVVCLLSTSYVTNSTTLHHLHLGISKHRRCSAVLCPVILDHLPVRPSFLHLIPTKFSAFDFHTTQLPSTYPFISNLSQDFYKTEGCPLSPEPVATGSGKDDRNNPILQSIKPKLNFIGPPIHVEFMLEIVSKWIADYLVANIAEEQKSPIIRAITDFDEFEKPKLFQLKQENFKPFQVPRKFIRMASSISTIEPDEEEATASSSSHYDKADTTNDVTDQRIKEEKEKSKEKRFNLGGLAKFFK